jgi:hypothetical protein
MSIPGYWLSEAMLTEDGHLNEHGVNAIREQMKYSKTTNTFLVKVSHLGNSKSLLKRAQAVGFQQDTQVSLRAHTTVPRLASIGKCLRHIQCKAHSLYITSLGETEFKLENVADLIKGLRVRYLSLDLKWTDHVMSNPRDREKLIDAISSMRSLTSLEISWKTYPMVEITAEILKVKLKRLKHLTVHYTNQVAPETVLWFLEQVAAHSTLEDVEILGMVGSTIQAEDALALFKRPHSLKHLRIPSFRTIMGSALWTCHAQRCMSTQVKVLLLLCAYSAIPRLYTIAPRMRLNADILRILDACLGRTVDEMEILNAAREYQRQVDIRAELDRQALLARLAAEEAEFAASDEEDDDVEAEFVADAQQEEEQ